MTLVDDLRDRLRAFLIPDDFVSVWSGPPVETDEDLARGGSYTWLVTPVADGTWVIGGTDRGSFAPYDRYETLDLCANAVRHLYFAPVEAVRLDVAEAERARLLAAEVERRIADGHQLGGDGVPVGTALDRFGPLSGHVLFTWRTMFDRRSSPPTDLDQPYAQLIVRRPLPTPFRSGTMAPWFGQPGGGAALSLPRAIRWYFDAGYLDVFLAPDDPASESGS